MGAQLLASKVVIVEEEPRIRNVPALPTSVLGAIGITERGPVGQAVLVTSFEEFVETFGGFTPNSDLSLAANAFFENGGQLLWVVRTVHYTDPTTPTSKTSAAATFTLKDRAAAPVNTLKVDGKWDGAYANDIKVVIAAATSAAATEFNLTVQDNGLIAEVFPNLSMNPAKPNYVETVINHPDRGSRLIKVTLLRALASRFGWTREVSVYGHVDFDSPRKEDPGPIWKQTVLPRVLDKIFGGGAVASASNAGTAGQGG